MPEELASLRTQDAKIRRARKRWEIALLLPTIGALIFMTPILGNFLEGYNDLVRLISWVFGLWGGLICAAYALSIFLRREMDDR